MRNSHSMRASAAVLGLSCLLIAGPVIAGGHEAKGARDNALRHSGTIVAIDQATRAITIEEQGPWYGEGTGLKRVTLRGRPEMNATLVERASQAGMDGWPGSFTTSSVPLSDLRVGDFVTLKAERLGDRGSAAVTLEVIRPTARDAEGRTEVPAASPATVTDQSQSASPQESKPDSETKQDSKEPSK